MKGKHLFILDRATIESVSDETVAHTIADLKSLDLYRLPYPRVAVRMPTDIGVAAVNSGPNDFISEEMLSKNRGQTTLGFHRDKDGKWRTELGPAHFVEVRNVNTQGEPMTIWLIHEGADPRWSPYEIHANREKDDPVHMDPLPVADLLITLLATKNVLKNTQHHPLARANLGSAKRPGSTKGFEYVTTISIPRNLEDDPEHPPRGEMAPHLRRGHIRRQHYGPRNALIKQVWIEPCFVNADSSFVSTRKAYNVAL